MNPRIVAGTLGAATVVLGLAGLFSPDRAMAFAGFAPSTEANRIIALCEARAVYGGLFTVLGAVTLWGAIDPTGKRSALLVAGLLWLGLCAGRSIGISVDGNPGLLGWIAVLWEATFGSALVWAAVARIPAANAGVE